MAQPATMKQARERFRAFTRSVLTDAARRAMRQAKWEMRDGYPTLIGNGLSLRFCLNEHGHPYAEKAVGI